MKILRSICLVIVSLGLLGSLTPALAWRWAPGQRLIDGVRGKKPLVRVSTGGRTIFKLQGNSLHLDLGVARIKTHQLVKRLRQVGCMIQDGNILRCAPDVVAREIARFPELLNAVRGGDGGGGFLELCNNTRHPAVQTAVMFYTGAFWVTQGWFEVKRGQCVRPLAGQTARYAYFFAEAGGEQWTGNTNGCVQATAFNLPVNAQCGYGNRVVPFKMVDLTTGQRHVNLVSGP